MSVSVLYATLADACAGTILTACSLIATRGSAVNGHVPSWKCLEYWAHPHITLATTAAASSTEIIAVCVAKRCRDRFEVHAIASTAPTGRPATTTAGEWDRWSAGYGKESRPVMKMAGDAPPSTTTP